MGSYTSREYVQDDQGVRNGKSSSISWWNGNPSLHQIITHRTPVHTTVTDVKRTDGGWFGTVERKPLHGLVGEWASDVEAIHLPLVSEAVASAANATEFLDLLALQPEWMAQDKLNAAVEYFQQQAPTHTHITRLRSILGSDYAQFAVQLFESSTVESV